MESSKGGFPKPQASARGTGFTGARLSVPGCDALMTNVPGIALLIRTADCLPVFVADPGRRIVGIAHVGWRGHLAHLAARLVAAMGHAYQCRPSDLCVALGPAIRVCCYEVGKEFMGWFGPHVRRQGDRYMCDLIGATTTQLRGCGIRSEHVADSGRCTACEPDHWASRRRDGKDAGRLVCAVMVRP